MAFDVALGADAVRRRNDSEALEPAEPVDNCFAHGAPTANRTSSTKINAEAVSSTSGVPIDRVKTNMAAPLANENNHCRWRIPQPGSITGESRRRGQLGVCAQP